ncbi:MAG: polymer-forming cytoskeletal protein, partial [Candidatus Marinimicrobia bacterium]|nr:polymer-forming cytoskeletal protein [Candidatus Neomarinimicrobiota bacterium]
SVERDGKFDGTAIVGYANVSGSVNGLLTIKDRLTITANGIVEGKITYGELEIGRGGTLNGKVKRNTVLSSALDNSPSGK